MGRRNRSQMGRHNLLQDITAEKNRCVRESAQARLDLEMLRLELEKERQMLARALLALDRWVEQGRALRDFLRCTESEEEVADEEILRRIDALHEKLGRATNQTKEVLDERRG